MQTRQHCLLYVALVSVALAACSVVSGRYLLDSDTSSTDTSSSQTLPTYAQCGGTGGNCAQYSSCSDSAYDGYICSAGDVSLRGTDVFVCSSLAAVGCIYVKWSAVVHKFVCWPASKAVKACPHVLYSPAVYQHALRHLCAAEPVCPLSVAELSCLVLNLPFRQHRCTCFKSSSMQLVLRHISCFPC